MNSAMHPTETDSLLPKAEEESQKQPGNGNHTRFIACSCMLLAAIVIMSNTHKHYGSYSPKSQLNHLNTMTQTSIDTIPLDVPLLGRSKTKSIRHHKHGKMNILTEKDVNPKLYHCTSTLMIMRHCDKGVKIKHRGHSKFIDTIDSNGDRHCNAKGMARSKYIASLFVEPEQYETLVHHLGKSHSTADIPVVPMVSSSLHKNNKVGYTPSKTKPQFPIPQKLYALNDSRQKHSNFREIETITPLADKFDLNVDESFGVGEEGLLAKAYFERLSESVLENVKRMKRSKDAINDIPESNGNTLCNNGLTVVNWKHSRIPILARALGCGRDEGCPKRYHGKDFDTLWMVTFQYSMSWKKDDGMLHTPLLEMEGSSRFGRRRKSRHGGWKISAQLLNEGFDPQY